MPKGPQGLTRPSHAIGNAVDVAKVATSIKQEERLTKRSEHNGGLAFENAREENTRPEDRKPGLQMVDTARWG